VILEELDKDVPLEWVDILHFCNPIMIVVYQRKDDLIIVF